MMIRNEPVETGREAQISRKYPGKYPQRVLLNTDTGNGKSIRGGNGKKMIELCFVMILSFLLCGLLTYLLIHSFGKYWYI